MISNPTNFLQQFQNFVEHLANTLKNKAEKSEVSDSINALSTVAKTGSYTDLTNKPVTGVSSVNGNTGAVTISIPAAQVQPDWNATSGMGQILNKPSIPSTPKAYITATYHSGTQWYRKWSDGFIEQGGFASTPNPIASGVENKISLNINFSNANYTLVATGSNPSTSGEDQYVNRTSKTTSYFGIITRFFNVDWYACGY